MSKEITLKILNQYRDHCRNTVEFESDADVENLADVESAISWVNKIAKELGEIESFVSNNPDADLSDIGEIVLIELGLE